MKGFANAVGIDVSKLKLDVYDYKNQLYKQFDNKTTGFKQLIKWYRTHNQEPAILCFEHTGLYSLPLATFLTEQAIPFSMVPGLEIKRSSGIKRGKNDKVDAMAISQYAYLRREQIKTYQLPSSSLLKLKSLLSLREKMVVQKASYQGSIKEMKRLFSEKTNPVWFKTQKQLLKEFSDHIKNIETEINQIIEEDDQLKKLFNLVTSVKGVGLILGVSFLVYTNGFTTFENWRAFASYSGTAPYKYQSGTSIKGRTKVSHLANKRMKTLLSNAASTCIQFSPEMRIYYERRLSEGKGKMSTQNIIRNKIIARVFATVKRGTPYVDLGRFAA